MTSGAPIGNASIQCDCGRISRRGQRSSYLNFCPSAHNHEPFDQIEMAGTRAVMSTLFQIDIGQYPEYSWADLAGHLHGLFAKIPAGARPSPILSLGIDHLLVI